MSRSKRWLALPVVAAFAVLGLTPSVAQAAPAPDQTYTATDDAYVKEAAPTTAEGALDPTNCSVNDDAGNRMRCLLKFNVTGLVDGDSVTGAEVRVVDKGNATGTKLVNINDTPDFSESTVTWNSAGTVGTFRGSQSTHVFGQDSVWTLQPGTVTWNGTYTFVLWSPVNSYSIGMNFQPKENTVGKAPPRLVLHVDHQSPPNGALSVTPTSGQAPLSVTADASGSTDPDNDVSSYNFEWGDATQTGFQTSPTAQHTYTTAGSYTVTMTVVDSGGRPDVVESSPVTVSAPPPPARNNSVWGANVHQVGTETFSQALAREDSSSSYGPLSLRLYFTGLPSTNCSEVRNAAANSRPSTISWKDAPADVIAGTDDATINAWLSCFTRPTQVTYYHEMEDNFPKGTAANQWISAWRHFSDLVDAHPNRANLKKTIIYGDFTWVAGSNRGLPGQTPDQFYLNWYPGDAYVDVFGADLYNFNENDGTPETHQTMAQHQAARPTYQAAVDHGKPYSIGEIGYDDPGTRPSVFQDWSTWLKDPSRNVTQVQYFDGGNDTTPQPGNHRLLDQASIDAWRDVIHS